MHGRKGTNIFFLSKKFIPKLLYYDEGLLLAEKLCRKPHEWIALLRPLNNLQLIDDIRNIHNLFMGEENKNAHCYEIFLELSEAA